MLSHWNNGYANAPHCYVYMYIACLGKRQVTRKDIPCCYEVRNILLEKRISWFMYVTYYCFYYHYHHHHHRRRRNHPLSLLRSITYFQKNANISDQTLLIYFSATNMLYLLLLCFITFMHNIYAIYPKQILFLGYITL